MRFSCRVSRSSGPAIRLLRSKLAGDMDSVGYVCYSAPGRVVHVGVGHNFLVERTVA